MAEIYTVAALSHLPESFRMEELCFAYIRVVAAIAGVNVHQGIRDLGIDMDFRQVKMRNGRCTDIGSTPLNCQAKSSKRWETQGDIIVYDLDAKNYNDLVNCKFSILVLLCLPPNFEDWVFQDEEQLALRKCCYFWQPANRVETTNTKTVRIFIPKTQIFTADALIMLLNSIQGEEQP